MSATYVSNLIINTYTDFSQIFTLEDTDSNSPLNLVGYAVSSQMRKHAGSSTATTFDASIYNSLSGQIMVGLTTTQTAALKPGRYVYDVLLTNPSGDVSRPIEGMVLVREGVTHL
jgi:hypothetical protein